VPPNHELLVWVSLYFLLQTEADKVLQGQVEGLNLGCGGKGHHHTLISYLLHHSTVKAAKPDSEGLALLGELHRFDQILGPRTSLVLTHATMDAEGDNHVALLYETPELFGEEITETGVIGPRAGKRDIVCEGQDLETRLVTYNCALRQITGEVRSCGGRAAVADDEDSASPFPGIEEQLDDVVDVLP